MSRTPVKPNRNNSILYLALLCLAYYLFSHWPGNRPHEMTNEANSGEQTYVEIKEGDVSTVIDFGSPAEISEFTNNYNIHSELKNGDKVVHEDNKWVVTGRISGIKSLSLGIPIGINSAEEEDLVALPGIGEVLAARLVQYRRQNGGFSSIEELLNVYGMGKKKLSAVRNLVSLD